MIYPSRTLIGTRSGLNARKVQPRAARAADYVAQVAQVAQQSNALRASGYLLQADADAIVAAAQASDIGS